jgi:hypothetical protein
MPDGVKGFLTVLLWTIVPAGVTAGVLAGTGSWSSHTWIFFVVLGYGFLYGLEAGILTIYDLSTGVGWLALVVDMTWSLLNTVFGSLIGNLIYIWFGSPSRAESRNKGWIVFMPRSTTGFGNSVLQTLGTVNLGGAGQHEKMHLLQARIFGPLYLPLFAVFYIVTFTLQVLWTFTLGGLLKLVKVRTTASFRPPASSAVGGFFGWIYYATPFELWAYASGNP